MKSSPSLYITPAGAKAWTKAGVNFYQCTDWTSLSNVNAPEILIMMPRYAKHRLDGPCKIKYAPIPDLTWWPRT